MDTSKNKPEVTIDIETDDFPEGTGTRVAIEMEAKFFRGKGSVETYLEQTAISNPHCSITFIPPDKACAGAIIQISASLSRRLQTITYAGRSPSCALDLHPPKMLFNPD